MPLMRLVLSCVKTVNLTLPPVSGHQLRLFSIFPAEVPLRSVHVTVPRSQALKVAFLLHTGTSMARLKVVARLLQIPAGEPCFEKLWLNLPDARQLALLP